MQDAATQVLNKAAEFEQLFDTLGLNQRENAEEANVPHQGFGDFKNSPQWGNFSNHNKPG